MKKVFVSISLILTILLLFVSINYSGIFAPEESEEEQFKYSKDKWNEMRKAIEEGREPGEKVVESTTPAKIELPPRASGELILPYDARLSINGRKYIGMKYDISATPNAEKIDERRQRTNFTMDQQMQVRINGGVGDKIKVNIDFDDQQADKRDISVRYQAKSPDEIVQRAEFGDIDVSLPGSEFVGYRKNVFGAIVDAKYKKFHGIGVWSQSKGTPEVKRFTGNQQLIREEILDINYVKKRYYQIAFGSDAIKPGSVEIWLDTQEVGRSTGTGSSYFLLSAINYDINASSYTVNQSTYIYNGLFRQLSLEDYTVNYYEGYVYFNIPIQQNYVIAIDYERVDGLRLRTLQNTTNYILIKDENNTEGITRELKNFYYTSKNKIVPDDGKGNFIMYVKDAQGNQRDDVAKYPDNIIVKFENGFFYTKNPKPFEDKVYKVTPESAGYRFFIEYRYVEKIFNLGRPSIVPQSERVVMDGKTLQRDVDYYLDYDLGILTFTDPEKIKENTVIDVSYEYSMFGLQAGETFLGTRVESSITNNIFIGGSYLGSHQPRGLQTPDLRSTPSSLLLKEIDGRIMNLPLKPFPLNMSISGEYATSEDNPNTVGYAMIDSMEGVRQEDNIVMDKEYWFHFRTPSQEIYKSENIILGDEDIFIRDINPYAPTTTAEKQRVLKVNYNLLGSSECSIGYIISKSGVDYSKKMYLDLWIYGDGKNGDIELDLGEFNEDVDGDGILDTEDKNNDGTLNYGEDVGWDYNNPDGSITKIGANNGLLDSEDHNRNGRLDISDTKVGIFKLSDGWEEINKIKHFSVDWIGWRMFRVSLNIPSTDINKWTDIRQIRITIKNNAGTNGEIKFAKISVVGNKWENLNPTELEIYGINNRESSEYENKSLLKLPPGEEKDEFDKLYRDVTIGLESRQEQALVLKYNLTTSTEVAIRTLYTKEMDLSKHKKLKLFLYGDGKNEEFFIRAGADDNNYFEYRRKVDWKDAWKLITIEQIDENKDSIPDIWAPVEVTSKVGNPSFINIRMLKIGIRTNTPSAGEIWVNEIFVDEPYQLTGFAKRYNVDFSVPGWMSFGGGYRNLDRNFKTFTQTTSNQDSISESYYLNFTRINFMPLSYSRSKSETITPSAIRAGELVSVLEEGKYTTNSETYNVGFNLKNFPQLNYSYSVSTSVLNNPSQNIFENRYSDSQSYTLNYTFPRVFKSIGLSTLDPIIPNNFSGSLGNTRSIYEPWTVVTSTNIKPITISTSRNYQIRTSFQFWKYLSLNPSYSFSISEGESSIWQKYTERKSQSASISSSLYLAKWLNPSINYNISTNESYNFPISNEKNINRNGSTNISMSINMKDILPNFKPTQSLTLSTNYGLEGGDIYERVESNYDTSYTELKNLLIQNRLTPSSTSYRQISITNRYSIRGSFRWNIFESINFSERLAPLKDLSTSGSYSESRQETISNLQGTVSFNKVWPDLTLGISNVEKIFNLDKIVSNSRLNFSIQHTDNETYGVSSLRNDSKSISSSFNLKFKQSQMTPFSISLTYNQSLGESKDLRITKVTNQSETNSYSIQVGFDLWKRHFTPRYSLSSNRAWDGDRKYEGQGTKKIADMRTQSAGINFNWDTSFPKGVKVPLFDKVLPLTNRFVFSSGFNWQRNESSLEISRTNTDTYSLNFGANYDVSANFRMGLNGGYQYQFNREQPKFDNWSFNMKGEATLIF